MNLLERIRKYHEEVGESYKAIAKNIGLSINLMYNFTAEVRDLKPEPAKKLDEYLKNRGY